MVNERQQEPLQDWERQALLTEYQTCQQENSAESSSYWTLTSIFIGFSSALLGGLVYGVLSNKFLLQAILSKDADQLQNNEILLFGIITCLISIAVLFILYFLKRWLKRVSFLQQINFYRMRDIERDLGMWASWRIHGVDHWRDGNFDREIKQIEQDIPRLCNYKPPGYEQGNFWQYWKTCNKYEGSSKWHYSGIFCVLCILWFLVLLGGLYSLYVYSCAAILIAIILLAIIAFIIFLYGKHNPKKVKDC